MGWDAIATPGLHQENVDNQLFRQAANEIIRQTGSADGGLDGSGLTLRASADALEKATGHSVYDFDDWTTDKVKRLWRESKWPCLDTIGDNDRSAVLSARIFLKTCAENGYGIYFSF